jgi:hypothetical protein
MADDAPLPSFAEECDLHNRRSCWDQETATHCCALCHRHSEATSSSSTFLPAQAQLFLRECFGCSANCCGQCTGVVEIGNTIKASFAFSNTDIVLCTACRDYGILRCSFCLPRRWTTFDLISMCQICDELVCNICVCPYQVENDPVLALCAGCLRSAEEDDADEIVWLGLAGRAP